MDFAKKQLEKYGWKEGQGLGKKKDGICQAIKPKLKFDTRGIGDSISEEIVNPWWQRVYDNAAQNIKTKKSKHGVEFEPILESVDITTRKLKKKKRKSEQGEQYKNFIQTSSLTSKGEKRLVSEDEESDEECKSKKSRVNSGICELTDDELFKACGGRTVHKGARHGLKMNAKLERIKQHEEEFMNKVLFKTTKKKKKKGEYSMVEEKH